MHTDEYEISLGREITHCQRVVKKIQESLVQLQHRYGMGYLEAADAVREGKLAATGKEMARWKEDFEALPVWEQRLGEYREALAAMRISASRF